MEDIQFILASIQTVHSSALAIQLTENSTPADISQAQADYYRLRMDMMILLRRLSIAIQELPE